jgi:hypothetical protein
MYRSAVTLQLTDVSELRTASIIKAIHRKSSLTKRCLKSYALNFVLSLVQTSLLRFSCSFTLPNFWTEAWNKKSHGLFFFGYNRERSTVSHYSYRLTAVAGVAWVGLLFMGHKCEKNCSQGPLELVCLTVDRFAANFTAVLIRDHKRPARCNTAI